MAEAFRYQDGNANQLSFSIFLNKISVFFNLIPGFNIFIFFKDSKFILVISIDKVDRTFPVAIGIIGFNNKENTKHYKKGEEIGMFNLGSTVILLINTIDSVWPNNVEINKKVLIRDEIVRPTSF